MEYLIILIICTIGGFAAGMTSFGYAIICMVLMPLFVSVKTATLVTLTTSFVIYMVILYGSIIKMKVRLSISMIMIPMLGSLVGRFMGNRLFQNLTNLQLVLLLCVFMVLLNIYFFAFSNGFYLKKNNKNALIAGAICGLFGGLNNVGGPPMVAYMYSVEQDRIKYTSYLQIIFLVGALYSLQYHIRLGNITHDILSYTLVGGVGVALGTYAGYKYFKVINKEKLTVYIRNFIFVTSVVLIIKTVVDIL